MQSKENSVKGRKKKEKTRIVTLTSDVSPILRAINSNNLWKNSSTKLSKNISNCKTLTKNVKKNAMTEEDIDRLFNKSKEKNKNEINPIDTWAINCPPRDFTSVKFLKIDQTSDKLLNGLPREADFAEDRINCLFQDQEGEYDLTAKFKEEYAVGKIIGQGSYASVRVAIYKPDNKKVAIKVYEKGKILDPLHKKSVRREIKILQMLDHPNIVKIFNVVQTNNHLNIVMEYLDGINLGNYLNLQPDHHATQNNAKVIIRALSQGLTYLHERQISHRDIKLQNVILDQNLYPKFIDFGFSTCIEKGKKVKIFCGTPSYMAPEIVQKKEYRGQPADVWALGVLAFVTLTGVFPFRGSTDQELYRRINNADYPRHQLYFSKQLSDLIGRMLHTEPQERITAAEILLHPWLRSQTDLKKQKKTTQSSECRKRTATSNHKSRQKEQIPFNVTCKVRKLTDNSHENQFKIQQKFVLHSPSAHTQRVLKLDKVKKQTGKKICKNDKRVLKTRGIQLLNLGLRGLPEDKMKVKARLF